jgi:ankyrin repeat protein
MRERGEMVTTPSPREYSLPLTVTQNEPLVDPPRGEPAVLCFGYRLGTGVPPWGPPPHPGSAVHRYGRTALDWAASNGNRRIIGLLVDANAALNAQDDDFGCAVCARGESAIECAAPSRRRRRPCRNTPLHYAAIEGRSNNIAELLLRGADGAVQNIKGRSNRRERKYG